MNGRDVKNVCVRKYEGMIQLGKPSRWKDNIKKELKRNFIGVFGRYSL